MPKQEKRQLTEEEKKAIAKAKDELRAYRYNIRYIEEKLRDIEETKALAVKVTPTLSPTKTNSNNISNDKIGDSIARLEQLKDISDYKIKQLLMKKFDIDDKIESLDTPYRDLLFYRYTRANEWTDVAKKIGYSESHTKGVLHAEALYLYSKIKNNTRKY